MKPNKPTMEDWKKKPTIIRNGDRIQVDKGICGIDFGVLVSSNGWSCLGTNGVYRSEKDGKEHIFDQAVHKITKLPNNKPTMDWENHRLKLVENLYDILGVRVVNKADEVDSAIEESFKDLLARQSEEWQGETLDERCDWHKDVEGGFHCQYCCPICNPELKNTGGKE